MAAPDLVNLSALIDDAKCFALVRQQRWPEGVHCPAAEISGQVAPGAHAVLAMDGAGWHQTGGDLRVPHNITPLRLPPYAPELNPVENVWAFLRSNKLSNRLFDTYDAILDACADAWNWLTAQPERITTIASRSWAQVNQ